VPQRREWAVDARRRRRRAQRCFELSEFHAR
jgi:hypothetical protein